MVKTTGALRHCAHGTLGSPSAHEVKVAIAMRPIPRTRAQSLRAPRRAQRSFVTTSMLLALVCLLGAAASPPDFDAWARTHVALQPVAEGCSAARGRAERAACLPGWGRSGGDGTREEK